MLRVRFYLWLLTLSCLAPTFLTAQTQKEAVFEHEKAQVRYLIFVPQSQPGQKLPLILFLHGAGERGDNLERVKIHGPPKIVEKDKKFPFVVVSPQCPKGQWWDVDPLVPLLDSVIASHPVNPDRVYLTGLSMGGYGTWKLAAKHPKRFAAAVPICGGGRPATAPRMKDLPIWAFHGDNDQVVKLQQSQRMVDALKALGSPVKLTVYPGVGHDSWTRTYENPKLYEWLLQHKRRTPTSSTELPAAEPETVGLSAEKLQAVDERLQAFIESKKVAGVVAMVARHGKVVYQKAVGKMDIEAEKAMQLDTIFRIYSMTKPIVSVGILQLVESGKLELDDPVSQFIPEWKDLKVYDGGFGEDIKLVAPKRAMTVRDLLRHTSGLTYGFFGNTAVARMYRSRKVLDREHPLDKMIAKLGKTPLLYQPGSRWNYSVSTDVLGYLIEKISGKPLDVFLEERIFGPLEMRDTGFHVPKEKLARFAVNYGPGTDGKLRAIDEPETSRYTKSPTLRSGGGGLVSTARDYLRFCQMLVNKGELNGVRILQMPTVEDMTRNHLPDALVPIAIGPGKRLGVGFGLGFSVRVAKTDLESSSRIGEYGWGGAASTHFWISPKEGLAVVALQQHMPYTHALELALKPLIYAAIEE